VFALYSDPRVWTHLPAGRHTEPSRSLLVIEQAERSRERTGLGAWAVRETASGRLAGTTGVGWTELGSWNLGYRFHPDFQGRGLALAVALHAIAAAHAAAPSMPVTARMLATNPASIRRAERAGLRRVWRGAAAAADGSTAERHVFADRDLDPDLLAAIIALG
jgi:[ribosomal protein S5]-alanine N-acetyltransferase